MASRKLLVAAVMAGAAVLGGCAGYPYYGAYDQTYYPQTYYPSYGYYSYGPGYYVAPPSVSFGLTYSDRGRYYYRDHWRDDRWRG